MKLKEKLAIVYSKNASDDFGHMPKQIIRQNAFLAGFEAAKQLAQQEASRMYEEYLERCSINIEGLGNNELE